MEHEEHMLPFTTCIYFIYSLYIQPTADISVYRSHIAAINAVKKCTTNSDSLYIFGDFNLNGVNWYENDDGFDFVPLIGDSMSVRSIIARELTSEMADLGLFQMSSFANKSGNVLDLVYADNSELCVVSKADFLMLPVSKSDVDHVPLACLIECHPTITSDDESNTVYCFKKANYVEINEHLSGTDLLQYCEGNVNDSLKSFYDSIYDTFSEFVPRATIPSSNNPKWFNKDLMHLKNIRNKEFKKLSTQRKQQLLYDIPTVLDDRKFLQAKIEFESMRTELHSNFIREKAHCLKSDPKSFWRHINGKRKSNNLPAVVELNGKKASTNAEKSNLFAEFFQSVYVDYPEDPSLFDFIDNRVDSNCFGITSTAELVLFVLHGMDVNKGSGHDGISSIFLRECAGNLAEPLNVIFNQSLTEKCYPNLFKIGQLTPIFKNGRKMDVKNYRGVNVMPNLAKVFERVVFLQLKLIIPRNISASHHGFVSDRNIESNLMELSVLIHNAFQENAQLDEFIVDISEAFDKVDKSKLIRKMAKFPLSNAALLWFLSYLVSRLQYVVVGSEKSDVFTVLSGVGQGSILGVIAFLMFFNDSDVQLPGIHNLNFADDKKMTSIIKSEEDAINLFAAIDIFFKWCCDNGMEINRAKSKVITYTLKRNPIIYDYNLDNQLIERTSSNLDLGVLHCLVTSLCKSPNHN
ncbi:uncharacterized protein LOC119067625 [Bradysia coprophila]|uniref:uncharacterized protein LOC119067625 n=1 Tax=Bradysia coprophila TaxID=38358 RepID=UPI00187D7B52|nr:uncharacterized protein LOC119067625 [Bradysia coprophila]